MMLGAPQNQYKTVLTDKNAFESLEKDNAFS